LCGSFSLLLILCNSVDESQPSFSNCNAILSIIIIAIAEISARNKCKALIIIIIVAM
jgi:hypothetical protein